MIDRKRVIQEVEYIDMDAAMFLEQHKGRYMDILNAFGEWVSQ